MTVSPSCRSGWAIADLEGEVQVLDGLKAGDAIVLYSEGAQRSSRIPSSNAFRGRAMISLAGRDIVHAWGKFVFTGLGLGLLLGVTLVMAGVYRGMVDDGKALLDNSGADLWVVQRDTLGPTPSPPASPTIPSALRTMPGVAEAANVTYLTMQVRQGGRDVRAMVVGIVPGEAWGSPGWPPALVAGAASRAATTRPWPTSPPASSSATPYRSGATTTPWSGSRAAWSRPAATRWSSSRSGCAGGTVPRDNDAIVQNRARTATNPPSTGLASRAC